MEPSPSQNIFVDTLFRAAFLMAFSIKQLLIWMAVFAFGLVAMFGSKPLLGILFDLVTLGILAAMAYGAWLSLGETRAFRVGFLCWAVLYFLLFKKTLNVPVHELISRAYRLVEPMIVGPSFIGLRPNFYSVCHSLLLLLVGFLGGWVTVYFYRRRERMLLS